MSLSDKDYIKKIAEDVKENPETSLRLIKRFLPLAAMLFMAGLLWLYFVKSDHSSDKETVPMADASSNNNPDTLDAEGKAAAELWAKKLGDNIELTLPNGEKIMAPSNGVEKQLLDFLNQGCQGDLKAQWFNNDRILFKTGSSQLNTASFDQINALSSIMKAFPTTTFKLGGYTDNTGDPLANKELSGDRAAQVVKSLVEKGVQEANLSSEGYGSEFPVCPQNDTDECKEKNRRVAIRVVKCK
jgi:outer membrane protein OmpA-like peptidoglycan-associated protein